MTDPYPNPRNEAQALVNATHAIKKLEAENARLREALDFYAREDLYHCGMGDHEPLIDDDAGMRAREALEETDD